MVINDIEKRREYFRKYMSNYLANNPILVEKNRENVNRNYWLKRAKLYEPLLETKNMTYQDLKKFVQLARLKKGKHANDH